jgi:hypothetical protein
VSPEDKSIHVDRWPLFTAVVVTLVALSGAFLGGDTTKVGEAAPIFGVGLLLLVCPFKALPNRGGLIGICGLIACAFIGFLPASWFGEPEWHALLRKTVPGLGNRVSLQPLLTFTRFCEMLSAIFFAIWVVQWRPARRVLCIRVLAGAIAILAGTALAVHSFSVSVPGWHPSQGFGPFANRNQMGTLMALGAMLALGLCAKSPRGHRTEALLWVAAFVLCLAALFYSNSRGPLCLLALGSFCGILLRQRISAKGFAIAASLFLCIFSVGLLMGGDVTGRIVGFFSEGVGLRVQIYQDTIQLVRTVPFGGIGLGNFDAVFPWFRNASLNGQRILHPESDWLWLVSETGAGALFFCILALACGFGWPGRASGPREKEVQLACKIGIVLFVINSLFDVPGHRLGTIFPLFVVAGICCRSTLTAEGARVIPWISRLSGIGLVVFGVFLLQSNSADSQLQVAVKDRDWEKAKQMASSALTRTPLNWSLYMARGYASIHEKNWLQAIAEFRCALLLEPKLAIVPFDEGRAWIGVNVPIALSAWKECLSRSCGDERSEYYRQILEGSARDERLLESTLRLSDGDPTLALVALRSGRADFKTFQFLEEEKPKLNYDEVRAVLKAEAMQAAAEKNYVRAYELGRQAVRNIPFPNRQQRSEQECRIALIKDPQDIGATFDLCLILGSEKRREEALSILENLCRSRDCPDYVQLMKAEFLASLTDWPAAWIAINPLL